MQLLAGGVEQVNPAQGSLTHAPALQPNAQVVLVAVYEQVPPAQVPEATWLRSVLASVQLLAGGVEQVTPAQGSPAHAPPEQPFAHVVSVGT